MSDPRRWLDPDSEASPEARSMLAAAKRSDEPPAERIAAVAARLGVPVSPFAARPAPEASGSRPPAAPAAVLAGRHAIGVKVGAVLVSLGLAGTAWYLHAGERSPGEPPTRFEPREASSAGPARVEPHTEPPALATDTADSPVAPAVDAVPARPRATLAPARAPGLGEADLVHAADAALRRDDARAALALARDHAARFPAGAHTEERERILIEALVRLGQRDAARGAAERFFARHPTSIYRARIEALIQ